MKEPRVIGPLQNPATRYKITHAGTQVAQWDFQNKATSRVHFDLPLFWKSYWATCVPACVILHPVTGSCREPIGGKGGQVKEKSASEIA